MGAREMVFGQAEVLAAGPTDESLLDRCRQGDPQAFARLVALHERMVLNLALRLLGDPEEAKDISQDAFLQVYKMLGRFEGRSSLKTWIYRIVLNLCRNRLRFWRRHHRAQSSPLEALAPREEARLVCRLRADPGPFECVQRRELGATVQAALLRLPFEQKAILLLREAEELSCSQIAAALGLREGTVKSRLARAREALRRELEPSLSEGDPL
jgi:RNA polymerase sigma-70 factor (ECF subfamily)